MIRGLLTDEEVDTPVAQGLHVLAPGKRRAELERWFEEYLLPLFGDRIRPVTRAIAD